MCSFIIKSYVKSYYKSDPARFCLSLTLIFFLICEHQFVEYFIKLFIFFWKRLTDLT